MNTTFQPTSVANPNVKPSSEQLSLINTGRGARRPGAKASVKLSDAGEKIGGSRKDQWALRGLLLADLEEISPGHAATIVRKHNVWRPDYAVLIESGCEPTAAALIKLIYDTLVTRPKENTVEGRKQYVTAMRAVREVLGSARTVGDVRRAEARIAEQIERAATADPADQAALHRNGSLRYLLKRHSNTFIVTQWDERNARKLIEAGFPNIDPWRARLEITEEGGRGTTEDGVGFLIDRAAKVNCTLTPSQIREGVYRVRLKCRPRTEFAYVATREEATAAAIRAYDGLHKRNGAAGPIKPERPFLDVLRRQGLQARRGQRGDAQDLIETFGFRGVEFGNWAASDERQRHVELAYEALWDLADVLGVEPAALSLDGGLGVALGARGTRFAAHYEPGRRVYNLSKKNGAGALGHEFGHALDHYFGELDRPDAYQTDARGATGWYGRGTANLTYLRPEIRSAWERINRALYTRDRTHQEAVAAASAHLVTLEKSIATVHTWLGKIGRSLSDATGPGADQRPWVEHLTAQATKAREAFLTLTQSPALSGGYGSTDTDYYRNATRLCGKQDKKGYWVRPTEMFARAFESYVFDRLRERGAQSDYLVHGVEPERFAQVEYLANPYPVDAERRETNAAIHALVQALRTRPGNKGLPALC